MRLTRVTFCERITRTSNTMMMMRASLTNQRGKIRRARARSRQTNKQQPPATRLLGWQISQSRQRIVAVAATAAFVGSSLSCRQLAGWPSDQPTSLSERLEFGGPAGGRPGNWPMRLLALETLGSPGFLLQVRAETGCESAPPRKKERKSGERPAGESGQSRSAAAKRDAGSWPSEY